MKFFYLCPDNESPSWGVGVIYHHVKALCELGYNAYIVHQNHGFILPWINIDVPIKYIDDTISLVSPVDIMVVPEVMACNENITNLKIRKILFLQASAHLFENFHTDQTHKDFGYERVMVILPHMVSIVERFVNLPVFVVPPMIADYFYKEKINQKRNKSIIIYPKYQQVDFTIIRHLVLRKIGNNKLKKILGIDWRLKALQGLSHTQVAEEFGNATFFISINLFEALNTSIVEAMASGCIVFCYEGFGPRDFLEDGKNAFVFANNEPYKLVEKLFDVLDNYDTYKPQLAQMQIYARQTAENFSYENMKKELVARFENY